jgi:nucleoside triphosphate diphosphatase
VVDISQLKNIMISLRHPQSGCPWDIEQDFHTIAPYTIEEAYEVCDAIERKDYDDLKHELGDLLFQVIFHSQIAEENGYFTLLDVVNSISEKLIRRHPHVFANEISRSKEEQTLAWEEQKARERAEKSKSGLFDDVPINLPPLMRAVKLTKRAQHVGFDWPDFNSVIDKLDEEIAELKSAIELDSRNDIFDEIGDILFVIANMTRKLDISPEDCLRSTNAKFIKRFTYIEEELAKTGRKPEDADLCEMERLWVEAKLHFRRAQQETIP